MHFAHPSSWDDPYERVVLHERSTAIFAQCWSHKAISDAMWRIYSPHAHGVRLGTTRHLLEQALSEAEKENDKLRFKIKKVEYLYQKALDSKLDEVCASLKESYTFSNAIQPLFLKRQAFEHEKETRVVVYNPAFLKSPGAKGITIKIDPFKLIRSIWIDPRAPDSIVEAYKYYLKDKLGFPGNVQKSQLYVAPDQRSIEREE
jgi:hypothetical protein